MKFRPLWLAIPACAVMAVSCKKEQASTASPSAAPSTATAPTTSPEATPAPVPGAGTNVAPVAPKVTTPALSIEERAAKLGIAKHLPKDTESLLSVYNGSKMADRFKKLKLWTLIKEESGGAVEEAEAAAEGPSGPGALVGQEVFIATGKGTTDQTTNLITLNNRFSYFQAKLLAKALVASAKGDSEKSLDAQFSSAMGEQLFIEIIKDPQSGVALAEKFQVPPIYVGFKTAPADREKVAQQVGSIVEYMGMAEEMVEPLDFDRAGTKFKGYRLLGAKAAEEMTKNREDMEEVLDKESVDRLIAAVAKKNIVVASATLGDYVVVFVGSSADECQLVADAKDSLASTGALGFADPYAGKELALLSYGADPMMDTLGSVSSGFGKMALGFRDGLAGSDGLGDTRDLEAMLQLVSEREQDLQKLTSADTMGVVSYFEQGLKIETFGGIDKGAFDWKTPNRLGDLGASSDVAIFANFTSDATYDTKARAYVESLVETIYAGAKKFAAAPIKDSDFKEFQEGFTLFDTKFRTDTLTLVDALRGDLSGGLGKESALVVDLKGSVPPIPGIPQEVADKGKFFRASWITPVTDRSKIQSSWTKLNSSTTNILKQISAMAGDEIPMQKPISSEKNGFTTWFFSFPFFSDDFMPSVTVSDKWFIASTSKVQALELGAAADKPGKPTTGFAMTVKIDPMRKFGLDWLKVVDENSAAIFKGSESNLEEFKTNKPKIEKGLNAMEDFEEITANVRREDNRLRGSIHFKTR